MNTSAPPVMVSVVIPVFKVTRYIAETLDSLKAQTCQDFEALLVNDGCPDTENLEQALQPYLNDQFRYLKSGKWASISGSRNTGILAARGKYIALLDGDDVWNPDYLSVQTGILEQDASIDLVYPDAVYFGEGPWVGRRFMEMEPSEGEVTMEKLIWRKCNVFIGITARRESLIRAGLFDPLVKGGEDWDVWMRLVRMGGKIHYHRQVLARYRMRQGSMSDDKMDLLQNGLTVYKKHLSLPDVPAQEREWLREAVQRQEALMDFFRGKKALYRREKEAALECLERANRVLHSPRIQAAILGLRLAPGLLFRYIHKRYPSEYIYLH